MVTPETNCTAKLREKKIKEASQSGGKKCKTNLKQLKGRGVGRVNGRRNEVEKLSQVAGRAGEKKKVSQKHKKTVGGD